MSELKKVLSESIPVYAKRHQSVRQRARRQGDRQLTIGAAFGGMRGLKAMVCDTSEVPPDKGLIIRGIPVKELASNLPEEIFWLLCVGTLPNTENWRTSRQTSRPAPRNCPTTLSP